MANKEYVTVRGGLGQLATWHLPGGPVGPPARWAATSNVAGRSGTAEGDPWCLAMEGGLSVSHLINYFTVTPLLMGPVCLISQSQSDPRDNK